jgi:hypothetical protein
LPNRLAVLAVTAFSAAENMFAVLLLYLGEVVITERAAKSNELVEILKASY